MAGSAAAGPFVRWVDRIGDVHTQDVGEVLSESTTEIKLRLVDGTAVTLEAKRLLRLVRERDTVEEQRLLLEARLDVESGVRAAAARTVLDRLAATGAAPWIRMYAEVARVELAVAAGEKDARARVDAALKRHAESRFVGPLLLARARLDGAALTDPLKLNASFELAKKAIQARDASWLARFSTVRAAGRRLLETDPGSFETFFKGVDAGLFASEAEKADAGLHLVAACCIHWAKLDQLLAMRERVRKIDMKPFGALVEIRLLRDRSTLLLPELRADIQRELAITMAACGRMDDALKEATAAVARAKEARDARRTSSANAVRRDIASGG